MAKLEILHKEKRDGVSYALKIRKKTRLILSSSCGIFVNKFFLVWVLDTSSSS